MRKISKYFSVFIGLLFLLLSSGVQLSKPVQAEELKNYSLNTTFQINKNRVVDGASYGEGKFYFAPTFTFPDSVVIRDGDQITYEIPEQFEFAVTEETDLEGEGGEVLGKIRFDQTKHKVITTITNSDYFTRLNKKKVVTLAFTAGWSDKMLFNKPTKMHISGYGDVTLSRVVIDDGEPLGASKWGVQEKTNPNLINWRIRLNRDLISPTAGPNVKVTDMIPANQEIVPGSIFGYYFKNWFGGTSTLQLRETFTPSTAVTFSGNTFTIDAGNLTGRGLFIGYQTRIVGEVDKTAAKVYNDINVYANGRNTPIQAFAAITQTEGTGTAKLSDEVIFKAKKILNGRTLKSGEFQFELIDENNQVVQTTTADARGDIVFSKVKFSTNGVFTYKIREIDNGLHGVTYDTSDVTATVTVTTDPSGDRVASASYDKTSFTNTYVPEKMNLSITKTWSDVDNQDGKRPSSVEVELLADGTRTGQSLTLDASNNWQASFSNLDKYDSSDNEIAYTVAEKTVPTGYRSTITGDMTSGFVVTNSHTPETLTVAGTKTWDDADDQDGLRPASITVRLMKSVDGSQPVEVASQTVGQAEDWKYSFKNQPKYEGGKEIAYSITEDAVADYQSTITGYQVTNTHTPAKRTVSVTKAWDDANDQDGKRPSTVKVQLYADGQKSGAEVTLKAEDGWSHTWSDLPVKKSGHEIVYTVKEVSNPSGYTASVTGDMSTGFTITNSHTPSTTQFEVTKVWKDKSNQDGKRPATITVNLLADGEKVSDATFGPDGDGNWKHTFTNLPEYKNGTKIVYSVSEEAVAGYTSKVKDHTITNSYTPETVTIAGEKTWNDSNDQDGKRPSKITVNLMKSVDGQAPSKVASKEVSQADDWKYSFKDQPKYEGGKEITYSISEETVAHYTSQINGYNLTNSYSPEKTEVSGSKTWDDADNQDGKRPASITVHLLANGSLVDSKTVSAADAWSYRFSDLPKYKNGEVITYSISEASVAGYTTRVDQFNLTNSYTPEKMDITVKKNWNDAQNQDGKRPSEITVHLLADGQKVASKKVTADSEGKWTTTFVAQPKYKAGQEIKYTISEDTVANYTTEIKDFDITNSYQPQVVDYEVIKKWDDEENQDGKRPDKITIHLMKTVAGTTTEVESKEISSADNWRYRFSQLPKYEAGQEITYSVTEDSVAGYTTSINGREITNSHTPETVRILGKKIWEDDNNQAGKRPSSITVEIRKGGEVVDTITVSPDGDGNWNFVSKELPKYEAGQEIRYQVFETSRVAGYEEGLVSEENGQYTITNKLTPEQKISVTGEVIWNDDGNQSGKRPSTVNIHLIVDGRVKESKVVRADSEGKWRYEFKDLPRYKAGKEIVYKISADTVDGYQLRVDGTTVIHTRQSGSKAQPNSSPSSTPSVPNGKPQGLDKGALVTPNEKPDKTGVSEGTKLPKEEVQQVVRRGHRLPLTGTTASLLVLIGLCLLGGVFYLKWKH